MVDVGQDAPGDAAEGVNRGGFSSVTGVEGWRGGSRESGYGGGGGADYKTAARIYLQCEMPAMLEGGLTCHDYEDAT